MIPVAVPVEAELSLIHIFHRNNAAGDFAGLYLASSSAEVRHSRLDGNASVDWPGMVALL